MIQAPIQTPVQVVVQPIHHSSDSRIEQNAANIDEASNVVLSGGRFNNAPTLIGRLCCTPEECEISTQTCIYSALFGLIAGALAAGSFWVYK